MIGERLLSPIAFHLPVPLNRANLSRGKLLGGELVLALIRSYLLKAGTLMMKLLEPRLLRGEAEMVKEGVSQRRDRGFASLRFRQVAPPTDEAFISRLAIRRLQTHLL